MRSAENLAAFVFLALSVVFGGLLASGVSSAEFWLLPFLIYASFLPYIFVVFALRPRAQKRPGWLLMRIFATPALAGLSEILFVARADGFGYAVMAVAIVQMLLLFAWDAFQIVRLIIVPLMQTAARGETLPIFERAFALMDRFYLRSKPIRAWVAWDDTLESVIRPHPYYTVDQVGRAMPGVITTAAVSWIVMALLGWIGTALSWVWPIVANLDFAAAGNLTFSWTPVFVSAFLATTLSVAETVLLPIGTYIMAEWNRRTWGAVVFRTYYFVFWIKAPWGTSFRGGNEIESVRSTKRFSAGEIPGKEDRSWWEQLWDGFTGTLSPAGVAAIALPVPALGGQEVIDFVGDDGPADGQIDVLRQIHGLQGTLRTLKTEGLGRQTSTLLLDPAREAEVLTFSGTGAGDVQAEVEELVVLYAKRVAETCKVPLADLLASRATGGRVVDLVETLRAGDPRRWSAVERRRLF